MSTFAKLSLCACCLNVVVAFAEMPDDFERYRSAREAQAESTEGHVALAQLCDRLGYVDRCRVHLIEAARLSPNQQQRVAIREAAGDIRAGVSWFDPLQQKQFVEQTKRRLVAWDRHGRKLVELAAALDNSALDRDDREAVERALAKLSKLDSPESEWLVAIAFAKSGPRAGRLAIELLSRRDTANSSLELARFAIDSPWASVRKSACRELMDRTPEEYVGTWLARLHTPVESRHEERWTPSGSYLSAWVLQTEGESANQQLTLREGYVLLPDSRAALQTTIVYTGFGYHRNVAIAKELNQISDIWSRPYVNETHFAPWQKSRKTSQRVDSIKANVEDTNKKIVEALGQTAWPDIPADVTARAVCGHGGMPTTVLRVHEVVRRKNWLRSARTMSKLSDTFHSVFAEMAHASARARLSQRRMG